MNHKIINKVSEYGELLSDLSNDALVNSDEIFDKYYHLYEYTDELVVFDDVFQYPGLMNYVRAGILTEDELVEALCYEV